MKFSLSLLFRCSKPLKDGIAQRLLGCPHTIALVLSYADTATLVACMRVSREFNHLAGKSLYHTVTVRPGAAGALLHGVSDAPGNAKRRLLAHVRVLTLAGAPGCRAHCCTAHGHAPFFPNVHTLRLVPLPTPAAGDHACSLLRGAAPHKAVIRNMAGLALSARVHDAQWSPAALDTLVIVLPTHGWLLQTPGSLRTGFARLPAEVKVVFWPLWEDGEGASVRPAEVMPTTVNPAQLIPSLRDLVGACARQDSVVTVYGLETLRLSEGNRFAAAVRRAYPPSTELTQAMLQAHVRGEIGAACSAGAGGGGGGGGGAGAAVTFRSRDEYVADLAARGGELKGED